MTEVENRPGLPELSYRIGTHPIFLRRMLAELPRFPGLAGLKTRHPGVADSIGAALGNVNPYTLFDSALAKEGADRL